MKGKNLIVCADGTWNRSQKKDLAGDWVSTNVAKLAVALAESTGDGSPQVCRYLEGVGTNLEEGVSGGAFGWGLSANVMAGYRFLVEHFCPGDRIYLFGFSRGAYTVRSLAGLILHAGILRTSSVELFEKAMFLYRSRHEHTQFDGMAARLFRLENSIEVDIEMIGVWDTVGSLGIPYIGSRVAAQLGWAWQFHDVSLGPNVRHAYHGLAIHERRSKFLPSIWKVPENSSSTLEQVWFSGVHSDIGGGYRESGLADITLKWMVSRASRHGLEFKPDWDNLSIGGRALTGASPLPILHNSFKGVTAVFDRLPWIESGVRTFPKSWPSLRTREYVHRSVIDQYLNCSLKDASGACASWPETFHDVISTSGVEGAIDNPIVE